MVSTVHSIKVHFSAKQLLVVSGNYEMHTFGEKGVCGKGDVDPTKLDL